MLEIPIQDALGFTGVLFLIFGTFLVLSGVGIIKVESITVTPGKKLGFLA